MTTVDDAQTAAAATGGPGRRLSTYHYRRPWLRLSALLAGPVGLRFTSFLGSLLFLLVSAFWQFDPFTAEVVREPTLDNFKEIVEEPVYRTVALRTIGMAAAVTVACAVLAFPIAY